jgi:hypothetical protein
VRPLSSVADASVVHATGVVHDDDDPRTCVARLSPRLRLGLDPGVGALGAPGSADGRDRRLNALAEIVWQWHESDVGQVRLTLGDGAGEE